MASETRKSDAVAPHILEQPNEFVQDGQTESEVVEESLKYFNERSGISDPKLDSQKNYKEILESIEGKEAQKIRIAEGKISEIINSNYSTERKAKVILSTISKISKQHNSLRKKNDKLEIEIIDRDLREKVIGKKNDKLEKEIIDRELREKVIAKELEVALKALSKKDDELKACKMKVSELDSRIEVLNGERILHSETVLSPAIETAANSDTRSSADIYIDDRDLLVEQTVQNLNSINGLEKVIERQLIELESIGKIYTSMRSKMQNYSKLLNLDAEVVIQNTIE